ncbi:MAG: cupin domain-containing protein [Ktedonobacterales bacterium]
MDTSKIDRARATPDPNLLRWFEGDALFQRLTPERDVELLVVFFERGSRTRPHIHPVDQTLYFVEGQGVVATENELIHTAAGDFVTIPAGVWHWHGAAPDATTTHISIKRPGATDWNAEEKNWGNERG